MSPQVQGDVQGVGLGAMRVVGIQGRHVSPHAPATGDSLAWNGQAWAPGGVRVFSVATYGATGNGFTDDTQAIQSTVNAASAAGGGVVHFPAGTYALKTYITLPSNIYLLGQGRQTTLKLVSGYVSGAQGQGHFFASGATQITLDSLSLDGNSSTVSPDPTNNFAGWFNACTHVKLRNCYVTGLNGTGSNINTAFVLPGAAHYGQVHNCEFDSCNGGAVFFQGAACIASGNILHALGDVGIVFNSTTARRCVAIGNLVDGISPQCAFGIENGASDWTISGNVVYSGFGALDLNDAGYAGPQVSGGVFANNLVLDMDKGTSAQTVSLGVFVRTSQTRNIKILNNTFSGLTVHGTTDSFVLVQTSTEGLEIRGNTFEGKAQALPAAIFLNNSTTHTRPIIDSNTIRSTSSTTKLSRGIWLGASSTCTNATIARNEFENITNYGVLFDVSSSFTGSLKDNWALSGVGSIYQTSPWGTFAAINIPHELRNTLGRSIWLAGAAPTTGTWLVGDQVWNTNVTATTTPGWICTTAGTPGTWTAMPVL